MSSGNAVPDWTTNARSKTHYEMLFVNSGRVQDMVSRMNGSFSELNAEAITSGNMLSIEGTIEFVCSSKYIALSIVEYICPWFLLTPSLSQPSLKENEHVLYILISIILHIFTSTLHFN